MLEWRVPGGDGHRLTVGPGACKSLRDSAPTHGTGAEAVAATGSWSIGGGVVVVVLLLVGLLQAWTYCQSTDRNEQFFL